MSHTTCFRFKFKKVRGFEFEPSKIAAIAVTIGPGSFTGIRVGFLCQRPRNDRLSIGDGVSTLFALARG